MSSLRILISGTSIAGPSLALWLNCAGAQVTVVERAPSLRPAGQTIDICGPGLEDVRRMGLEEAIKAKRTKEQGISFVDARNRSWAAFPVNNWGNGGQSFTSDIEILRGDLARVFYYASKDKAEYVFGKSIEKVVKEEGKVKAEFLDQSKGEVDLVIAADGLISRTRDLVFGEATKDAIFSLGRYPACFTIPRGGTDEGWSRWFNAPERGCVLLRPAGLEESASTRRL